MGEIYTIVPLEKTDTEAILQSVAHQHDALERALMEMVRIQREQAEAIRALEREVRECVPLTAAQEKALNAAIREKARDTLRERGCEDRRKADALARIIRKDVLQHWGCRTAREIPRIDYNVALEAVGRWRDVIRVRALIREE